MTNAEPKRNGRGDTMQERCMRRAMTAIDQLYACREFESLSALRRIEEYAAKKLMHMQYAKLAEIEGDDNADS